MVLTIIIILNLEVNKCILNGENVTHHIKSVFHHFPMKIMIARKEKYNFFCSVSLVERAEMELAGLKHPAEMQWRQTVSRRLRDSTPCLMGVESLTTRVEQQGGRSFLVSCRNRVIQVVGVKIAR